MIQTKTNNPLIIVTDTTNSTGCWFTKENIYKAKINNHIILSDKLDKITLLNLVKTLNANKILFCTNKYINDIYGSNEILNAIRGCIIEYEDFLCMFSYSGNLFIKQYELKYYQYLDMIKFCAIDKTNYIPFSPELELNPGYTRITNYLESVLASKSPVAFDLETLAKTKYPFMLGLSNNPNHALVIKFLQNNKACFCETEEANILFLLKQIFESNLIIAHNMCYDYGIMLDKYGFRINNLFDTMIAWHTIEPELKKSLGMVASLNLNRPSWKHTSQDNMAIYNALDTANTFALYEKLNTIIKQQKLETTFILQMKSVEPVIYMGLKGLNVNVQKQQKYKKHLLNLVTKIKAQLCDLTKNPKFNPASPKQVNKLLYTDLNLPEQYRLNTKNEQTLTSDEKAIEALIKVSDNLILQLLLKYRKYAKLLSTYFDITIDDNKKVYTSYNITGTTSGRWSSSASLIKPYGSGNLQNIPPIARKIYIASPGKTIIQADYSQAEAVVVAYLTNDIDLINAFKRRKLDPTNPNNDIHRLAASMIFNVDINSVSSVQRQIAKKVRHAVNYQMGVNLLAVHLDCSRVMAKKYWQAFYANNPNLASWHKQTCEIALSGRPLITPMKRQRYFRIGREYDIKKACVAFIPQSTVGDMLNHALNTMYWEHNLDLLMQLHDAVYIESHENDVCTNIKSMYQSMQFPITINNNEVVLDVDFKVGKCWGQMTDYKIERGIND